MNKLILELLFPCAKSEAGSIEFAALYCDQVPIDYVNRTNKYSGKDVIQDKI